MKIPICLFALCLANSATAEPCVSPTFDVPLPNAQGTESFVSDIPSAQFPAFWQRGTLDGYAYRIYASLEGTLRPVGRVPSWEITMSCDDTDQSCSIDTIGAPPQDAMATADKIGQCLLGQESGDAAPGNASDPDVAIAPAPDLAPAAEAPCGAALVNEATDVATLQRLLTLAGRDPGPVDGFLGPKSFAAMEAFVPGAGWGTSIPATIAAVDEYLCSASAPN